MAEAALAHTVSNKVEAAYRRTDFLDKRRLLMRDWAAFCKKEPVPSKEERDEAFRDASRSKNEFQQRD